VLGYLTKTFNEIEMNKYVIFWAIFCATIFQGIFVKLDSWLAFPALLKWGLPGLFQLKNLVWVVENWQSVPNKINAEGIKLNVGLGD
jgi:hypothetical protein